MTLTDAIIKADILCANKFDTKQKTAFISYVEAKLIKEVLTRYSDVTYDKSFKGYDSERDGDTELIAEAPYDEMYSHYVAAQMHLILHEQIHYNNELTIFNSIFEDYKVHMNRTHHPKGPFRFRSR